jgi:hypothetical protein
VQLDYDLLFACDNNIHTLSFSNSGLIQKDFSNSGRIRGNLLTALLKYDHNEHLSSNVVAEVFMPGDYYTDFRNDTAFFGRYELVLTW